jgi:hypothetical protein
MAGELIEISANMGRGKSQATPDTNGSKLQDLLEGTITKSVASITTQIQ